MPDLLSHEFDLEDISIPLQGNDNTQINMQDLFSSSNKRLAINEPSQ
jgi:hypothetical protein